MIHKKHSYYLYSYEKSGRIILCDQGALLSPHFEENLLKVVWTISGLKESYLKREASGYHCCSRKVTGHSEMTSKFSISPDFFETEREEQEEDMKEFVRYVFPGFHPQLKGLVWFLVVPICFNYDSFI